MPVSVVVGGQFGSEGKGKVALELARLREAVAVVRVGGANSGHTAVDAAGRAHIFRHLPTAALLPETVCVIGAGSYLDPEVLLGEIAAAHLSAGRVLIDPHAVIIEPAHRERERDLGLGTRVGSTLSGTGAAVAARVERHKGLRFAEDEPRLQAFVHSVTPWLRSRLRKGARVIIEGTQGFGLSLLHSGYFPYVTSRDTTAGTFVAEAGLSPLDVDEIVLVIRAFPIRVAGASGELPGEIDWTTVTSESGSSLALVEKTSVTKRLRRVARFDPELVRRSIEVNKPTLICLNHVDYVDALCGRAGWTPRAEAFITSVEASIGRLVDYVGAGPGVLLLRPATKRTLHHNGRTAIAG